MAIRARRIIAAVGLSCPDDIAFACFDDIEWGEPRISTVAQPTHEIDRAAVSRLIGRTMIADGTKQRGTLARTDELQYHIPDFPDDKRE